MIDRSYLPFKSAREYIDRGMSKWMGFFISEHTTALSKQGDSIGFSSSMSQEEKLILISQVYIHNVRINLFIQNEPNHFEGVISDISSNKIYFKTDYKIYTFSLDQVIKLSLTEDIENE